MKKNVLVVVDIQPVFEDSFDESTLANIQRELLQAMENNDQIIFLEYENAGCTVASLWNVTSGYDQVAVLTKAQNSGGPHILKYLRSMMLDPEVIKVCGVNTDACVFDTVQDLSRHIREWNYRIQVIRDACNTAFAGQEYAFYSMSRMNKVRLTN